jgi:KipI family sensor histidine kinase inhibitor
VIASAVGGTHYRVLPSGDQCLVVEFGTVIDVGINRQACALAQRIEEAALAGVVDVLPSFAAVGVHYLPADVPAAPGETAYAALARRVRGLLDQPADGARAPAPRVIEVPVCYGGEFGPDLDEAAQTCALGMEGLIALHAAAAQRVFMIGFTPGHPYVGLLDARLDLPRRSTPRTSVPAGSVAIANRQTVIYPLATPGGWHLIGRTPLTLFDVARDAPCLLRPGDQVRFLPISAAQFAAWPREGMQ